MEAKVIRRIKPGRWEGVSVLPYKEEATHFRAICRMPLVAASELLAVEVRYFEIEPGGYSTLERHDHVHVVVIQRGHGRVLLGDRVEPIAPGDVVTIPSQTWHQFQPNPEEPVGFLCLVNPERDRPIRPTPEELADLSQIPEVAAFLRT